MKAQQFSGSGVSSLLLLLHVPGGCNIGCEFPPCGQLFESLIPRSFDVRIMSTQIPLCQGCPPHSRYLSGRSFVMLKMIRVPGPLLHSSQVLKLVI